GAGTVGTALAIRLSQQGYRVITVHDLKLAAAQRLAQAVKDCRILEKAQGVADTAEFVFITTVDDFIPQVAAKVSWHTGQTVVHCSGAASTEALAPAKEQGARVGCIHPLQTFASITQAVENLPGSTFAIEAEEPTLSVLKELATSLQGSWLELKAEDKALYHASACIACNYFYTLVQIAADLWQNFGVSAAEATRAMMPMLRGSLNNLGNVGLPQALTGPIARGDLVTIRKHRAAFEKKAPAVLSLYKELGNRTIPIGLAKGTLTESRAEELRALFKENQK
ncbi:MAG: DUF2520 domain-containing protein, partial [Dehalococcoidales bacterium]|nr:DUF2520 domain-containing protein [Dehalococcoidales bacterium]